MPGMTESTASGSSGSSSSSNPARHLRTLVLPKTTLKVKKSTSIAELLPLAMSHRDWIQSTHAKCSLKMAIKDVAICRSAFPAVCISKRFLLASAAWFYTLTHVDDLLEDILRTDPAEAADIVLTVLNAQSDRSTLIFPRQTPREATTSAGLAKSIIDGLFRRLYSIYQSDDVSIVLHEVYETFQGWKAELASLDSLSRCKVNLDQYMAIKQRTIGISVFAALVYLPSSTTLASQDSALAYFEDANFIHKCAQLVAYQNDLFGLARDLQEGETMNSILLIHDRNPGSVVMDAAKVVLNMHNDAINDAIAICDSKSTLQQIALTFVARHAEWASQSSRYRV